MITEERLQEIKDYFNTGIHDDIFPERLRQSVCMAGELFYAYEQARAELAEAKKLGNDLRKQLAGLENLYNSDRVKYLDDITLLQTEVGRLRRQVTIAQDENTAIEEFIAEHGTIR